MSRIKDFGVLWLISGLAFLCLQIGVQLTNYQLLNLQEHLLALGYNFLLLLQASSVALVIYFLLTLIDKKIALILTFIYFLILIVTQYLLVSYRNETGILLGADLYGYTINEIIHTVQASGSIDVSMSILMILTLGILIFGFLYIKSRVTHLPKCISYILLALLISSWIFSQPTEAQLPDESTFNQIKSPTAHFINKSFQFYFSQHQKFEVTQYPFLKKTELEDPLNDWLRTPDQMPNIVFVAVEGLGADFVGPDGIYKGATPFLDSLINHSLYWKNCLSNTGRTFGVLPSLSASLPYSGSGFMDKGPDMPNHISMFSWLKSNGYHTSYFYGGNANFDFQDVFLERNQLDYLLSEGKFPDNYQKMTGNKEGFSWGYGDRDVFDYSINKIKEFPMQPRFSFYMTLSTHEPFISPEKKFDTMALELAKKGNEVYQDYQNIFSCIFYTDDALRGLLNSYSQLADFDKTIFVITGDHRLIPIPAKNRLSRFHVPLIIYSPLLKKTFSSDQIIAHSQIAPSFMSWLSSSYDMDLPDSISYISPPLPEDTTFGSKLELALMRNKNELVEYISDLNLLSNRELYYIEPGLNISRQSNVELKKALNSKLETFGAMSHVAINENRLIPSSLGNTSLNATSITSEELEILKERGMLTWSPDSLYFAAREMAIEKKFEESRTIIKYALGRSPNYHDLRVLMGRTFAWDGNYDSAIYYFKGTLQRNENYEDAYSAYSDAAYWNQKSELALELAQEGLRRNPESLTLKAQVARGYLERGDSQSAKNLLNEVLKMDPNHQLANQLSERITS